MNERGASGTVFLISCIASCRSSRFAPVTRTVFPTVPPRVDYELTKLGHSLLQPVNELGLWARQNQPAIQQAQALFDASGKQRTSARLP